MTQLTGRFDEALLYTRAVHGGQKRQGDGGEATVPYVAHLLGVAALAIEAGATEDQAILLHDAVEDQGGRARLDDIRMRFGEAVATIVADCSDSDVEPKPEWRTRKEAYLASLSNKSVDPLLVSLADKIHNAEAILADLHHVGTDIWKRFKGGRDGTLWYYQSLAREFERLLPGSAAARLARAVSAMHEAAK